MQLFEAIFKIFGKVIFEVVCLFVHSFQRAANPIFHSVELHINMYVFEVIEVKWHSRLSFEILFKIFYSW
jgi:hypothetical protein